MAKAKGQVESRLIVVDANILRGASSTDGGPPAGKACRQALQEILSICHRAVVSPALEAEYDDHASPFAQRWRGAMARRNKIVPTPAKTTKRARGWMQSPLLKTTREKKDASKDLHLVLAAWETGAAILSGDDRARGLYSRFDDLGDLGWARLSKEPIVDWLRTGAVPSEVALG